MERSEPLVLLGIWKVDRHISTRRHDVKLWIKDIDSMNNTVEVGKSEGSVRLILPNCVLADRIRTCK